MKKKSTFSVSSFYTQVTKSTHDGETTKALLGPLDLLPV